MPSLRVHFSADDLVRTRIRAEPDVLWELVLSLHRLQSRRPTGQPAPPVPADVTDWKSDVISALSGQALGHAVCTRLIPLVPISSYFPDFLTPPAPDGLEPGLDAVLSTPRARISVELVRLTSRSGAPSWGADLSTGDSGALHHLGHTMRAYYAAALAPRWNAITARVTREHTRLTVARTTGGIQEVLSSLRPMATWHAAERVLEAPYPVDWDLLLQGRGMTLIPSWFCCTTPVALADPSLPPVLVYPLAHDLVPAPRPHALAKLIGPTRARILTTITTGTSTTAIRSRTGISPAQVSRHAAVLRDNGLIVEARHAGQVHYTRTPLGDTLIVG